MPAYLRCTQWGVVGGAAQSVPKLFHFHNGVSSCAFSNFSISKLLNVLSGFGFGIQKNWYIKKHRIQYCKNLVSEKVWDLVSFRFCISSFPMYVYTQWYTKTTPAYFISLVALHRMRCCGRLHAQSFIKSQKLTPSSAGITKMRGGWRRCFGDDLPQASASFSQMTIFCH